MTWGVHHVLTWIIIGLVAGSLASRVVARRGFGCLTNIAVGLAGALIGGLLLSYLRPQGFGMAGDVISDIIVAFIGATILLALLRLIGGGFGGHGGGRSLRHF